MRILSVLLCLALLFHLAAAADFSLATYTYNSEKNLSVNYTSFSYGNNSTAQIVKIGGEEALLLLDGKLVSDRATISTALTSYYQANFYPSQSDMAALKGYADAFNNRRNAQTRYGLAEKICYEQGTFLSHKPCNDMRSCTATATLVCTLSGADGCTVDLLAQHILVYSQAVTSLNSAYAKFQTGYAGFSASTASASFDSMSAAFDDMKAAADKVKGSKLIFPETYRCMDCIGICPEPKFDYGAITSGKAKIVELRAKTAPFANLNKAVDKIALSTQERVAYRDGEEKAKIYEPKYNDAMAKYGLLKNQTIANKALVGDGPFVSAADAFLSKGEELDNKVARRQFEGFDAALAAYGEAGDSLAAQMNNSTSAYLKAQDAQDGAGDKIIEAMWKVNRMNPKSIADYNALAERKNQADARFKPPMTSTDYASLAAEYSNIQKDAGAYITLSASTPADGIFMAGNSFSRSSVDGTMSLAASMVPISFKTRQSMAAYVLPVVLGVIDLSILAIVLLAFVGAFYHFHGFFRSKLAISGWVLTFLGFVFVLLAGSVGFYGVVLSNEKYATFVDFFASLQGSDRAAVVVYESGVSNEGVKAMEACAGQIESQLALMGKKTLKYYISNGNSCSYRIPKGNATNSSYEEMTGLSADRCLDALPDIPVFDLKYSAENQPPVFTTVVTKQALFKGNEGYYGKKPMCDIANVLN